MTSPAFKSTVRKRLAPSSNVDLHGHPFGLLDAGSMPGFISYRCSAHSLIRPLRGLYAMLVFVLFVHRTFVSLAFLVHSRAVGCCTMPLVLNVESKG